MLDSYHAPQRRTTANGADNAALVCLDFGSHDHADAVAEFRLLCRSAGLVEVSLTGGRRSRPDPAQFAGSGKVAEIAAAVQAGSAAVAVFNHALAPAQQRNLESALQVRVIDRTTLILDIFSQRAKSYEGKIQVELAQLRHLATRLVRGWTHLERQKGGIGLRGPGETQLETDRRLLGNRVKLLTERLAKLQRQRDVQRRARNRAGVFSVSLVGYTNAGKSTLFNALTKADAYAADKLFATLDTTSRRVHLGAGAEMVVSDTVGFIRDLPHTLVDAFRATLEETVQADLLLHVVDAASPQRDPQIEAVNKVLADIEADDIPQLLVLNQIDRVPGMEPEVTRESSGKILNIKVSAFTGAGIDGLRAVLADAARDSSCLPTAA